MKRLLLFHLCLFTLFLLSASEYYESNVLMQEKAVTDRLSGSGYELEKNGEERILYLDGEVVKRVSERDGVRTVTDRNSVTLYEEGRPVKITREGVDGKREELYEYSPEGVLKRVITVTEDGLESITEYDYTPSSGLSSFRRDDYSDPMYIGRDSTTFISDGDAVKINVVSGLILRESSTDGYSVEDDTVRVREGSDELFYSAGTGLLMEKRTGDGTVTKYEYRDGELVSEESRKGSEVTLTEYLPSLIRTTMKEDGVIRRIREKGASGITETVYRNSMPYAVITYDSDGKRVLEVRII